MRQSELCLCRFQRRRQLRALVDYRNTFPRLARNARWRRYSRPIYFRDPLGRVVEIARYRHRSAEAYTVYATTAGGDRGNR
jgi:hypothetical protein